MNDKGIFSQLAALPILALFLGVGIMGIAAALTWDKQMTQSLLTAGAAICGGGLAIFAVIFGAFAGLAFYKRATTDTPNTPRQPDTIPGQWRTLPGSSWDTMPPALPDPDAGSWISGGPASYDLAPRGQSATYARDLETRQTR